MESEYSNVQNANDYYSNHGASNPDDNFDNNSLDEDDYNEDDYQEDHEEDEEYEDEDEDDEDEDDSEDDSEDGDEETERHPNDEDVLMVEIDTSNVIPVDGVDLNLDSSPIASESLTQPAAAPFEGVTTDPANKKPIRAQLRQQMKTLHPDKELMYWFNMFKPVEPDEEHEARKVLEPPKQEFKSGKRKREEKSETNKAKDKFSQDILTADISMFEALQNKYYCDGTHLQLFDAAKMCQEIRKDRRRRRPTTSRQKRSRSCSHSAKSTKEPPEEPKPIHWSSKRVAEDLGYIIVPREDLKELPEHSFSVYNVNGIPVLYSLANYFGPMSVEKGDLKPSAPSVNGGYTSVTKSATTFNEIQTHHQDTREYNTLVNYCFYRLLRPGFWAYMRMSNKIWSGIPGAKAIATHDPSLSTGKAVIYSRHTPLHFDNKEAPEGWSPLVIMGTCKTGMLSVPRLGIKFPYVPGHLVLLRGRLLDHEVIEWDGKDIRICVAHFTHVDEWGFAGIVPPLYFIQFAQV
ncbi:hypothetical protein FRC09_017601 [Ceratobasidium sp. 395]|nr:hypothetical protein FRC09_017601 [Ceratobasidium sp. 395]